MDARAHGSQPLASASPLRTRRSAAGREAKKFVRSPLEHGFDFLCKPVDRQPCFAADEPKSTPCRDGQLKLASSNRPAIPEPTPKAIGAQSRLGRCASIRIHRTALSSAV
jgi:hypothetical protein